MRSTMPAFPLTLASLFEHGRQVFADSQVITWRGDGQVRQATFARVAERAERLAAALRRLGVRQGDRVATFAWNNQEHLEAYLAVPCMGAVLHTLNIRLSPEQIAYIINHAEDRIILVDQSLVPLLARVKPHLDTVERYVVFGGRDGGDLGEVLAYEDLLECEEAGAPWPELDEHEAAAMCYTSGTTGTPKGVAYSHRSMLLHALASCSASSFGLCERDRVLPIVPMFHVNAWGLPYSSWLSGADMLLPDRFLQPEPLCEMIRSQRPTFAAGVPTIFSGILKHLETHASDLSSLRLVICGGAAVPSSLMEMFEQRHGVRIIQAWGMTETSPLGAIAMPPLHATPENEMQWRSKTGRVAVGVQLRIVDDQGQVLPWDGKSIGEVEIRGPWVTSAYYRHEDNDRFHDGWLRTGDMGSVDPQGYLQITDRIKDVIKSGGEWISSIALEAAIVAHPDVLEAAVIGVPDERWSERPLACVVLREGAETTPSQLREFLTEQVPRWWLPERWSFMAELPKTSVGKLDKKVLRACHAEGALAVTLMQSSASV